MRTGAEASLTWRQALGWRLRRHFLGPCAASVPDVVARLGAVPPMDRRLARLAVGVRCPSAGPDSLDRAVEDGAVITAFAFRGAQHHLSPVEGGAYLALRAAGRQWERASWVEHYRLPAEAWPDFRAAVREALAAGSLTIGELGEALAEQRDYRHLAPVFADGAGTLVKPLSWQGDLSVVAPRDGQLTVRGLVGNPRWGGLPDLDEAGPWAILQYFGTYGPATHQHVHYWLGEGLSAGRGRLRSWLAGLGERLVPVDVEGTSAFVLRDDLDNLLEMEEEPESVWLLPGHDQWLMGAGTKDPHVVPNEVRTAMTRKANPVLVDGVVRGTWTREPDGEVTISWFDGPSPSEHAVRRLLSPAS